MGGGEKLNLCVEIAVILQGVKPYGLGKNAPIYHVYPVCRTIREERAERSRGWGWGICTSMSLARTRADL